MDTRIKTKTRSESNNMPASSREDSQRLRISNEQEVAKQSRTLFVRSLPCSASNENLAEYFSQAALLKHATAILDKNSKQCKGYGFVTFIDSEEASKAKTALDGSLFLGKRIQIDLAERRIRDLTSSHGLRGSQLNSAETTSQTSGRQGLKRKRGNEHGRDLPPPRVIVRNLPWSVKEPEQLSHIFTSYGKVKEVQLPRQLNGNLRGFGFVLLRGRKNAENAISQLNGRELDGRILAVDWAAPKDVWLQQQSMGQVKDGNAEAKPTLEDGVTEVEPLSPEYSRSHQSDDGTSAGQSEIPSYEGNDDEDKTLQEKTHPADELHEAEQDRMNNKDDDDDIDRTVFVRNIPFSADDNTLYEHFSRFGPIRYARTVMDYSVSEEGRSKGTGFVAFYNVSDTKRCLKNAPRLTRSNNEAARDKSSVAYSLLEDAQRDPSGDFTIDGRILQVDQCLGKGQARRFEAEGRTKRNKEDRRHLFLFREGNVQAQSPLFKLMSDSELRMRESSIRQRQLMLQKNPALHISLTRLAIRNIPRSVSSKELKALARQAVVGFATEVKEGKRLPLSLEERARTSQSLEEAEERRKTKGKGIVKQAKVIFESRDGSKVTEGNSAGRSRGYGFIEYFSHRCALMGLRWLNGHLVQPALNTSANSDQSSRDVPKRLIVEFAIENAQVVQRRQGREQDSRAEEKRRFPDTSSRSKTSRKLVDRRDKNDEILANPEAERSLRIGDKAADGAAVRQQIVGRKRAKRKARSATS